MNDDPRLFRVRRLGAMLRGEVNRPTKTVLYTHLVVRGSCGAIADEQA